MDIDEFLVHELNDMVKKIGLTSKKIMYYIFLKPDMTLDNGLHALGNDDDVRKLFEYISLGYKMMEVYIEHEYTNVHTYLEVAFSTPTKKKCVIEEITEDVIHERVQPSKMKPKKTTKETN